MKSRVLSFLAVPVLAAGLSLPMSAPSSAMTSVGAAGATVSTGRAIPVVDSSGAAAVTIREGVRTSIIGRVPRKYRNSVVILEASIRGSRVELGTTVSSRTGKVSATVDLGGSGTLKARWRVFRNGKIVWNSKAFDVVVKPRAGESTVAHSSFRVVAAASASAESAEETARRSQARPAGVGADVFNGAAGALQSAAGEAAKSAAEQTGTALKDFGGSLAESAASDAIGVATDGLSFGFRKLFGLSKPSEEQQLEQLNQDFEQLSSEVQAGFAQVESQLTQVEDQLSTLEQQVSNVQQQLVAASATSASTDCVADMNTADGYVNQIKTAMGEYKTVLDPDWVRANLVEQPRSTAIEIVGDQIFGAGPGVPPFASGVVQLQTAVTALGDLLNSSTGGLVGTCGTAVSAGVGARNFDDTIWAPGSLAAAYYNNLRPIASYYASWLALGQLITSEGGQLAVLSYSPGSSDVSSNGCAGVAPSEGASIISCPGVVWATQHTISQFDAVFTSVGASWNEVTMGRLVGDNRVNSSGDYVAPAENLWVRDIAAYGDSAAGYETSGSWTPNGPLTSTTAPSGNGPAHTGANGEPLGQPTWLGLNFAPATSSQWDRIIPGSVHTGGTAGQLMGQAGLLNDGSPPSDLIILTGETSPFDTGTATTWSAQPPCFNYTFGTYLSSCPGLTGFPTKSLTALSFIDTAMTIPPGNPIVIGPPANTTSGTPMYANDVMAGADDSTQLVEGQECSDQFKEFHQYCENVTAQSALSLIAPSSGVTNQPGFWNSLTQTNSWTYGLNQQDVYSVSDQSSEITSVPGFMIDGPPDSAVYGVPFQYAWPANALSANGRPSGSSCDMTEFTTGTDGDSGIGNICASFFGEWLAGALGIDTGQVSIAGGQIQGTVTPAGHYAAQAVVTNKMESAQSVSLFFKVLSGDAQLGTLVNGASSSGTGVNITRCKAVDDVLECQATVPPGQSVLSVPLTEKFNKPSRLLLGLTGVDDTGADDTGVGTYSASRTYLLPIANSKQLLPPAVRQLTATSDDWADQTQPNGGAPLYASVRWRVPSVTPALTGFAIYMTDPTGKTTYGVGSASPPAGPYYIVNESAGVGQPFQAGQLAGIDLPLPDAIAGNWRIGVAAKNAAGQGPVVWTEVLLGTGKPLAPVNFQAVQTEVGTARLTWDPVIASPVLTNYAISISGPDGNSRQAVSTVPAYEVQNIDQLGEWTFSLTAVNAVGSSPAVTDTLKVRGMAPTQPLNLDMTVDGFGWLSASWTASASLPDADAYYVALYEPGATSATSPTFSTQIEAPIKVERIRIADFYQLAKDSPAGSWLLAVTPVNKVGIGEHAATQLAITPGLTQKLAKERAGADAIRSFPSRLLKWAHALCSNGDWSKGANVFGTCSDSTFTPADPTWSPPSSGGGGTQPGVTEKGCSGDTCSTVAGFVSGSTAYLSILQADPDGGVLTISEDDTQLWTSAGNVPTGSVAKATIADLASGVHTMTLTSGSLVTTFMVRIA